MAPDDTRHAAASAALTAATLAQGRSLHLLSLALLLPALATLLLAPGGAVRIACLALSLVAGTIQAYHAVRSGLDAALFAHWARCWSAAAEVDVDADLQAFDQSLGSTFGQSARAPRPLAERVRGALGLLRRQAFALALQGLTLFAAMAAG
ncbi:hypothetical protein [Zoogloea sp.]|uniref:hypothetical protein n=1 Tax=Zoogloea sp. TaxID=49181 RepID=UPI0035AD9E02